MHRMRAVALAAAALVLTATFPSGAARAGEPLAQADARRKREQVERQLDVARASDAQVEAELARLETDLANRRREATRVRAEAEAAMESVRVVRAQVEALRRQAAARQADFDRRIVDSYIHSGLSDTSASPLEALDAMDALRREAFAVRMARDDDEVTDRLQVAKSDLQRREAALAEAEAAALARLEAADAAVARVEGVVTRQRTVKAELDARIEHLTEEADALAREEQRIQALLAQRQQAARPAPSAGSSAPAPVANPGGFAWPLSGPVTSGFGPRWGRMHTGIDIDGDTGDPVRASKGGVVISASPYGGYGNLVVVDHGGGFATFYAHLSSFAVSEGEQVAQGTVVGAVGSTGHSTGSHLHFEVRVSGSPRDPRQYLP